MKNASEGVSLDSPSYSVGEDTLKEVRLTRKHTDICVNIRGDFPLRKVYCPTCHRTHDRSTTGSSIVRLYGLCKLERKDFLILPCLLRFNLS